MKSRTMWQVIFVLTSLSVSSTPSGLAPMEVGGSVYPYFYVDPTGQHNKGAIAAYHENPALVREQLTAMYNSGQRKISLLLWFLDFMDAGTSYSDYIINSQSGRLPAQQETNLRNLLNDIASRGFTHIQFRFAPLWNAAAQGGDPGSFDLTTTPPTPTYCKIRNGGPDWRTWTPSAETQYQQNKNFIFSTRAIIEDALASTPAGRNVRRIYDLGAEQGGIEVPGGTVTMSDVTANGITYTSNLKNCGGLSPTCQPAITENYTGCQIQPYIRRLWTDYIDSFGNADSYGFSVAAAYGRLSRLISTVKSTGKPLPNSYAIDFYFGTELNGNIAYLNAVKNEIAAEDPAIIKPIILQEAFYNDDVTKKHVDQARSSLGLDIRYIMQYDCARDPNNPTGCIGLDYAQNYDNYLKTFVSGNFVSDNVLKAPHIHAAAPGCADQSCIWISGDNIYNDAVIEIRDLTDSVLGTYTASDVNRVAYFQEQGVALVLNSTSIWKMKYGGGVRVYINSPIFSVWSAPPQAGYLVRGIPPQITNLGLGCADNHCIWILGNGFSTNCQVNIYPPDWSSGAIATITNAMCTDTGISFVIPPPVLSSYDSINLNVVNVTTGMWSDPRFLTIR